MKKLLTGLILIPVALIGCTGQKPEKDRFINATKEITCLVLKATDLFDPALENKSKDIFKNYGFNPDDDKSMQALADKYKDDAEVKTAVEGAVKECGGADLTKKLEGITGTTTPAKTEEKTEPKTEAKTESKTDAKTDATVKTPAKTTTPATTK
ncbi:MAG: hypothetical protein NTZ25_01060 [Candidatus Peregrinibacteria bacterium]|nr:hypothetical protein [Candidatus Peregrinibacteria bacterium]